MDTNVPGLGDDKTPINQVNKFYAFWYAMKSWRDFSYLDEYDPEDAESREEKRWMERKNAKERTKHENQEQNRIRNLVDLSYKLDPRIRRVKEQELKEKEEARQRRLDMIKKKQEEEEKKKQAEKDKEEAEQQRLKEEKEAERKERTRINNLKKKKRQIIRQVAKAHNYTHSNVRTWIIFRCTYPLKIEYLCENLELDPLVNLANALASIEDPNTEKVEKVFLDAVNQKKQDADDQKQASNDARSDDADEAVVWTPEEVALLTKVYIFTILH